MLTVRNLQVRYGQAIAVAQASLEVPDGGWVALVGANGAGKTSLVRAVIGLARHGGAVLFAGRDVSALPAWERQRLGVGYVPEGRQVFPEMSVEENLRVGGYTTDARGLRSGLDWAYEMFPRLRERRGQAAGTLSGGEQQMVALARALMTRPRLLVIDEISWGLMPILVAQVFERLQRLHAEGLAILQVEQNVREVLRHAETAYVMAAGQIVLQGKAADVAADQRVVESYVG